MCLEDDRNFLDRGYIFKIGRPKICRMNVSLVHL